MCHSDLKITRSQEPTTSSDISILNYVVQFRILYACCVMLAAWFVAIIQTRDKELIIDLSFHLFQTRDFFPLCIAALTMTIK